MALIDQLCDKCGGAGCPGCRSGLVNERRNDWPALVRFSSNPNSDSVTRSRYRTGKVSPTLAAVARWCREQGLRFTVDADGVRVERTEPSGAE